MRRDLFMPTTEAEARLLLLIDGFTTTRKSLEGRTKLAKLDFFLRYPLYLKRALLIRDPSIDMNVDSAEQENIESRMVRYRYGPWDPAYYALLGRLIGKGLVIPVPESRGIGFKSTESGRRIVKSLAETDEWKETAVRVKLLKRHLDRTGTYLKEFIYEHFPEVTNASWGDRL